jgi:SAM-dependent methyltransferase
MREDRWIWDRRYCEEADLFEGPPVPLLPTWLSRLPRGRALDLAAGCGRNALYLARQGYRVDAIDISIVGLARLIQQARAHGVSVRAVVADLDELPLPEATYDLIVMTYYLNRQLFPQLPRALVPGGALVVETPMYDPRADPPEESHPHRVRPGELLEAFSGLDIVHYEERLPVPPRMRGVCQVIAFRVVALPGRRGASPGRQE